MTDCKTKFVISLVGQAHCLTIASLVARWIFEARAACIPNPWVTVGFLTELPKHDIGAFASQKYHYQQIFYESIC